MALPSAIPSAGTSPKTTNVQSSGTGGSSAGLVLSEIRGVCIAFSSNTLTESPLWTRLDDPTGPNNMWAVAGYSVDRGRQYELDQTGTGTARVRIIDLSGSFDPSNGGAWGGNLKPMKQGAIGIRNPVTGNWSTIFRGFVTRWGYDLYQNENYAEATIEMVDGMEVLGNAEMTTKTFWGDEPKVDETGNIVYDIDDQVIHRLNGILNDAEWPIGLRDLNSGNVSLQRTVYSPRTQALTACQDAADAEFPGIANFYFSRDGKATFQGRLARFHYTDANYHISQWKAGDLAAVNADSTKALIFELDYDLDSGKVINEALCTPQGIADTAIQGQYVDEPDSIAIYGRRGISFENLLTKGGWISGQNALDETKQYATFYVNNYSSPHTRINTVTFNGVIGASSSYSEQVWRIIANVEISDRITITTSHGGGGGFNETFYVEGIHYEVTPLRDPTLADSNIAVTLTLDLSPSAYYAFNPFNPA